jgi:hypothetical protein
MGLSSRHAALAASRPADEAVRYAAAVPEDTPIAEAVSALLARN